MCVCVCEREREGFFIFFIYMRMKNAFNEYMQRNQKRNLVFLESQKYFPKNENT